MNAKNIFGAFTLAVALFFFWPAVYGSWQEVGALRTALDERQQLQDSRNAILTKAGQEYAKYQAAIGGEGGKNFTQLVPVKKNTAELVSAVQDIAQNSGVQLVEILVSDNKGKASDAYKTLSFSLQLLGPYQSFRDFLDKFESYVRILNVGTLQISTDLTTGQLRYELRADTYFLK